MWIDTHCHLDFPDLAADEAAILERAKTAGVEKMITISTHVAQYEKYKDIAERHDNVFFTIGTHPHYAHIETPASPEILAALAAHPKCVGIGEAGLDYHYDRAPRDLAQSVFRNHIAAARITGLPLVIHARDADDDVGDILEEEAGKGTFKALLHCFTASRRLAERSLALGLYVSFSGVLTFKNSESLREIARDIPLDRLLVETDAPYLAPAPHRGKKNEPAFVAATATRLAEIRTLSPEAMAKILRQNTLRLFSKISA